MFFLRSCIKSDKSNHNIDLIYASFLSFPRLRSYKRHPSHYIKPVTVFFKADAFIDYTRVLPDIPAFRANPDFLTIIGHLAIKKNCIFSFKL